MAYQSIEDIKRQMERYCAYQERSHYQVEQKLYKMGMIPEAIDVIVLHLIQENFLNEERFAKAYVRGKFYHKKWGKLKIVQGLKQHRIHQKLIDKALQEIDDDDYLQTIRELIEKQQKIKSDSFTGKQKIARYLKQKGYRYDEFSPLLFKNT
jgi:regulatory protein